MPVHDTRIKHITAIGKYEKIKCLWCWNSGNLCSRITFCGFHTRFCYMMDHPLFDLENVSFSTDSLVRICCPVCSWINFHSSVCRWIINQFYFIVFTECSCFIYAWMIVKTSLVLLFHSCRMTESIIRVALFLSSKDRMSSGVYSSNTVKSDTAGSTRRSIVWGIPLLNFVYQCTLIRRILQFAIVRSIP